MAQFGSARHASRADEDAFVQVSASVFAEKEACVKVLHEDLAALVNDRKFDAEKAQVAVGAWDPLVLCVHSQSLDLFVLSEGSDENQRAVVSVVEAIDFDHPIVAAAASNFAHCFLVLDESGCLHCVDSKGVLIFSRNIMDTATNGKPVSMTLLPSSLQEDVEDVIVVTETQWVYVLSGVNLTLVIKAALAKVRPDPVNAVARKHQREASADDQDKMAMQESMKQLKVQRRHVDPSSGASILSVAQGPSSAVVFSRQDDKLTALFTAGDAPEQRALHYPVNPESTAKYWSRSGAATRLVFQSDAYAYLADVRDDSFDAVPLRLLPKDTRVLAGFETADSTVLVLQVAGDERDRIFASEKKHGEQRFSACLLNLSIQGRIRDVATSWDGITLTVQHASGRLGLLYSPILKALQTCRHTSTDILELVQGDNASIEVQSVVDGWVQKGRLPHVAAILGSIEATLDSLPENAVINLGHLQEIAKCTQAAVCATPGAQHVFQQTHQLLANMEATQVAALAIELRECWRMIRTTGIESLIAKLCVAGQWQCAVATTALYHDQISMQQLQGMLRHIPKGLALETYLNLATIYAAEIHSSDDVLGLLEWAARMFDARHSDSSALDCAAFAGHALELTRDKAKMHRDTDVGDACQRLANQCEMFRKLALLEMYLSQRVPLEEYSDQAVQLACEDAIEDIPINNLTHFVAQKLKPMAAEMGLCHDEILLEYIHHRLHADGSDELADRLIGVVNNISSEHTRATALLTLLRSSILPRQQLSIAADLADTLLHSCCAALREQLSESIRVVRLTAVSFTYGILAYDALNTHHAREIVRVIVSSDTPTCLEDAIQFTKAYSSLPPELAFVDFTEHAMHLASNNEEETDPAHSKRILSKVDDAIHKTFIMLNDHASLNRYVEEMVSFCLVTMSELMQDSTAAGCCLGSLASPSDEAEYRVAAHAAAALCASLLDRIKLRGLQSTSWLDTELLERLRTVTMLAKECQLYVSVDVLLAQAEKLSCVKLLLDSSISAAVKSVLATKSISGIPSCMARARRACDLLQVDWSVSIGRVCAGLIQEGGVTASVNLAINWLKAVDSDGSGAATMACDLGVQLSRLAMKADPDSTPFSELFALSYSLMSHAAIRADPEALHKIADFIHASDVMIDLCIRCGECDEDPRFKRRPTSKFFLPEALLPNNNDSMLITVADDRVRPWRLDSLFFRRDGVVLQLNSAKALMFGYLGGEMKIRGYGLASSSVKRSEKANIIDHLIDHDNMGFALRLLLSSWYIDEEAVEEIIRPYAIKIVSSDTFDSALAVSTLSILSQPHTMKVLREVIPRVRNDFKRLQMLAVVGSELASLWSHNEFSFMCEQLERNTHWWRVLSALAIDFDPNCFGGLQPNHGVTGPRVDEHLRQLIPQLLDKTNLDIASALEFCQHYQIEESAVAVHYIEHVLLIDDTAAVDEIRRKLDMVLASVQEARLVSLLRQILSKLPGHQYERIELVCHLLLESELEDEAEALTYNQYVQMLRVLLSYMEWHSQRGASYPRIPFWQLLEDPWGVLAKVMLRDEDRGLRLLSLCEPLRLRTDEFYLKLIMVHADEKAKELSQLQQQQQQQPQSLIAAGDEALVLSSSTALDEMVPFIDMIVDKNTRQHAWVWLFERFKTTSEATAVFCVTRAVEEIGAVHEDDEAYATLEDLIAEREILRNAIAVGSIDSTYRERFREKLSDTEELVRELVQSCANDWATQSLRGLSLLQALDTLLSGLQTTVKVELSDRTAKMQRAIASIVPKSFNVQEFIQSSVMSWLHCPLHDPTSEANDRTRSLSSIWLNARAATQSCFSPTSMEERKRHDLHNALCICFVLFADSSRVSSWLERLLATIKASKSGRITHRSRLRLLIASFFLMADPTHMLEFTGSIRTELQLFQLLGESEVLRLPYSPTSLQLTFRDPESLCRTLWRDAKSSSTSDVLELLSDVVIMHKASTSSVLEDMLAEVRRSQSGRLFLNIMAGFCEFAHHLPTFRMLSAECITAVLQELEERCRRLREVYVARDPATSSAAVSSLDEEVASIPLDEVKLVMQQAMLIFSHARTIHTVRVEASIPTILQAIHQLRARCTSTQALAILDAITLEVCRFATGIATSPFSQTNTRRVLYQAIALFGREMATQLIVQSGQISQLLNPVLNTLWLHHRQEFENYLEHLLHSTCKSLRSWPVWHAFIQWLQDQDLATHDVTRAVVERWVAEGTRPEGFVAELNQQLADASAACS